MASTCVGIESCARMLGDGNGRTLANAKASLKYRWYLPKIDELQIIANATLEYDFK